MPEAMATQPKANSGTKEPKTAGKKKQKSTRACTPVTCGKRRKL